MGRPRQHATATARQAAYRRRVERGEAGIAAGGDDPGQGARRVDVYITTGAALGLRRLARHRSESQAKVLGRLIDQAVERVMRNMNNAQLDEFLDVKP